MASDNSDSIVSINQREQNINFYVDADRKKNWKIHRGDSEISWYNNSSVKTRDNCHSHEFTYNSNDLQNCMIRNFYYFENKNDWFYYLQ